MININPYINMSLQIKDSSITNISRIYLLFIALICNFGNFYTRSYIITNTREIDNCPSPKIGIRQLRVGIFIDIKASCNFIFINIRLICHSVQISKAAF